MYLSITMLKQLVGDSLDESEQICQQRSRKGRSDGGISVFIAPPPKKKKSTQVNFLRGKNDVRTAIQQFYTPQKLLYPQKTNFWLRLWKSSFVVTQLSETRRLKCRKSTFFHTPLLFRLKFGVVSCGVDTSCWGPQRVKRLR